MDISERLDAIDWGAVMSALDARGHAVLGPMLTSEECAELIEVFDQDRFRKHIVMEKHSYGLGDYKYFRYPLLPLVQGLREATYPRLFGVANRWARKLGRDVEYPPTLEEFLAECHREGQHRPTPLILRYEEGGYNRLHQDLYGAIHFPLQLAILLSTPGKDFTGGEVILTEQRARVQVRPHVVRLGHGEAVVFAVNERPTEGKRGPVRVTMRHGVSELESGKRYTLGVIFHDAE